MIWFSIFIGLLSALLSAVIREVLARRRESQLPVCGCGHHLSFHNGIECSHLIQYGNQLIRCGCARYIGPNPPLAHLTQSDQLELETGRKHVDDRGIASKASGSGL